MPRELSLDHPLRLRKTYEDPADQVDDSLAGRRWSFGVAAGALLVAGTFAAGALGLSNGTAPFVADGAPDHAPAAPGNSSHDIGGPAAAPPPEQNQDGQPSAPRADQVPAAPKAAAPVAPAAAQERNAPSGGYTGGSAEDGRSASQQGPAPAPAPPPGPEPAPAPAPAPKPKPGPIEQIVTPVTDTVGDVVEPVTDTVDDILSPVTGILSTGDDQSALAMIDDPLAGLLGR